MRLPGTSASLALPVSRRGSDWNLAIAFAPYFVHQKRAAAFVECKRQHPVPSVDRPYGKRAQSAWGGAIPDVISRYERQFGSHKQKNLLRRQVQLLSRPTVGTPDSSRRRKFAGRSI